MQGFDLSSLTSTVNWVGAGLSRPWLSTMVGLFGLAVGIVGIVLYLRSKTMPRPRYTIKSLRLIGEVDPALSQDVEIRFRDVPVTRLTRTLITLWNDGNEILRGADIVEDDPVRFSFDEADDILQARVLKATKAVNKIAIEIARNPNEAICTFDYLDPQDGAVIELLHTSQMKNPRLLGSIRGLPQGFNPTASGVSSSRRQYTQSMIRLTLKPRLFAALVLLSSVLIAAISLTTPVKTDVMVAAAISAGIYFFMGLNLLWSTRRRYPAPLELDDSAIEVWLPGGFQIVSATYGTDEKQVDVTSALSELIENGRLQIVASNDIAGDPHPGVKKHLNINYKYKNRSFTKSVMEDERVVLP